MTHPTETRRRYQCRCVVSYERCNNTVGPDQPFCAACEDRHADCDPPLQVSVVPLPTPKGC